MSGRPETKPEAEALVPQFQLERVLNQGKSYLVSSSNRSLHPFQFELIILRPEWPAHLHPRQHRVATGSDHDGTSGLPDRLGARHHTAQLVNQHYQPRRERHLQMVHDEPLGQALFHDCVYASARSFEIS